MSWNRVLTHANGLQISIARRDLEGGAKDGQFDKRHG